MLRWALLLGAAAAYEIYVLDGKTARDNRDSFWFDDVNRARPALEVKAEMTVQAVLDMVNYNEVEQEDLIDYVGMQCDFWEDGEGASPSAKEELCRTRNLDAWRKDGGQFLYNHARSIYQPGDMYTLALFGGRALNPARTLESYGISARSTLLLRKSAWDDKHVDIHHIDCEIHLRNNKVKTYRMFYGEDMMNLYNVISFREGYPEGTFMLHWLDKQEKLIEMSWVYVNDYEDGRKDLWAVGPDHATAFINNPMQSYGQVIRTRKRNPLDNVYSRELGAALGPKAGLAKMRGELRDNKKMTFRENEFRPLGRSRCACHGAAWEDEVKPKLTSRQQQLKWGQGCKAHDEQMKYCKDKRRNKGNRNCWCPLEWCYTTSKCGVESKTNPGLYYSYTLDECGTREASQCYQDDEDGRIAESYYLDNYDFYNLDQVEDYMENLVEGLVKEVPTMKKYLSD